ncbi:MAG: peptidase dimerization domain-containing protein [Candidatus Peribacteria bacterium]|jgi:acetylornithine deacetylase/succinyl-diaminopimelate desuccinylase-like protein|nr:peptidase dimerization domain-containing protein [Candidatus Peribacteria bacterium]
MLAIGQRGMLNFDITLSHTTSLQQGETKSSNTSTLNPLLEMSKLLSKLYNLDKIYITFFYYNVEKAKQETEIRRYGTNLEYKTITRSTHKNHTILTPTLDITGIISFPKFEKSTTIPKKVIANLEMHLVPHQRYAEIINGLQQWLKLIVPQQLKAELLVHEACNPCKFELQNPYTQKAITLLSGLLKTPLEYQQNLYGLKAVEQLQKSVCPILISLPFASEESGIGRANEHLTTETVKKALDFCMAFFGK